MRFNRKPNVVEELPSFKMAHMPSMFDSIKVINGSQESIFDEVFVVGVLPNGRVVKFKESALKYNT